MKFLFLVFAVFGLAFTAQAGPVQRGLNEDLQDFIDLLPSEQIRAIIEASLEDPEVQNVIQYLFSQDFADLVNEIADISEFQQVVDYLDNAGLRVREWIVWLREYFGIQKVSSRNSSTRGVNDVIQEIKAILPLDDISALYKKKLDESPAFAELIAKMQSPVFKTLLNTMNANPKIQDISARLQAAGVDVLGFVALLLQIFGLGF